MSNMTVNLIVFKGGQATGMLTRLAILRCQVTAYYIQSYLRRACEEFWISSSR
jgi:hypothetical protein